METDPRYHSTWGIQWENGYFRIYLMWMHWNTHRWCASPSMVRKHYRKLETALAAFDGVYGAVIIFPCAGESDGK